MRCGAVKRVQWKNTGELKQKHKKQPFSDASASHLSLVVWLKSISVNVQRSRHRPNQLYRILSYRHNFFNFLTP